MFSELAEKSWVHSQVLGFVHSLSVMPQSSMYVDILKHNISARQQHVRTLCVAVAIGLLVL